MSARFNGHNQPKIRCNVCHKLTTPNAGGGTDLCAKCYHEAGLENEHQDGEHKGAPNPECPMCKEAGTVEPKEVTMARGRAADLIDYVRVALANRTLPDIIEAHLKDQFGVEPLKRCDGEAHGNAHIDNCGTCMPRWGWTGPRIKVT